VGHPTLPPHPNRALRLNPTVLRIAVAKITLVTNEKDSNLSPGGWAEFQDYDFNFYSQDGTLKPDNPAKVWCDKLLEVADRIGRTACPGSRLEGWVKDAGFENVAVKKFKFPLGMWPKDPVLKEVGTCNLIQMLNGLEAFSMRLLCDGDGWSEEQVHVLLAQVRKEAKSSAAHIQYDM